MYTSYGQNIITITCSVPKNTDDVYIVGNQESLGNWNPKKVKMTKISDFKRAITLELQFPAEFKFTRGSWESVGVIKKFQDDPNLKIDSYNENNFSYKIKNWADWMASETTCTSYQIKKINSHFLEEERILKIYVPEENDLKYKFPVFYLTDGDVGLHFDLALQFIKQLERFNIIPKSILVGISQKNRGNELDVFYSENGERFKNYIFEEVVPFINNNYSTTGFNSIIGHSDGATFNHILMTQNESPFRGYINISENLFNNQLEVLENKIKKNQDKPSYVFIASGEYDSIDRIASGKKLDTLFNQISNEKIKHQHNIYKADHNDLFIKSLLDGIQFVFSDYQHLGYDENKLKTLALSKINAIDFWDNHTKAIKEIYGINLEMNIYDYYFIKNIAVFAKDKKMYEDVVKHFNRDKKDDFHYYTTKAQEFERMDLNDEALHYWLQNIEEKRAINHIFYYRRPYELMINKLNKPIEAINFLEKSKKTFPEGTFYINYYIAKAAVANNIKKRKAKENLEYCIKNFKENRYFTLEDVQNLMEKLK
ncbi:hypothetical protein GCM10022397_32640 [Flavivirga jejuensis]